MIWAFVGLWFLFFAAICVFFAADQTHSQAVAWLMAGLVGSSLIATILQCRAYAKQKRAKT